MVWVVVATTAVRKQGNVRIFEHLQRKIPITSHNRVKKKQYRDGLAKKKKFSSLNWILLTNWPQLQYVMCFKSTHL